MTSPDCLRNITAKDVGNAIGNARRRVVFLAPGLDADVANALAEAWQRLGPEAVSVILDLDAEVIRLGYGTEAGLDAVQRGAGAVGALVSRQPGVRICVVIADDVTFVYAPTPLLIEAGSAGAEHPNGLALGAPPAALNSELGLGFPEHRKIGLSPVRSVELAAVQQSLKENPPLKFDVSRRERVFNAKLEFVEFELEGCFISRHTVTIPPELVGFASMKQETRDKLRSSFQLIEPTDMVNSEKKISEQTLRDERKRISRKFLKSVTGFGMLILRTNRAAFEREVESLRGNVKLFQEGLKEHIETIYKTNAARLTTALLPAVAKDTPPGWTATLGTDPTQDALKEELRRTLLKSFGNPDHLLKQMRVCLTFKGVTYGTLVNPEFTRLAGAAFPNLQLHDEFDAARGSEAPVQRDLFSR